MNVNQKRDKLKRTLSGDLPQTSLIVSAPDHPLLSRGPDVIVGSQDGILAFMFLHASERESQINFQTRVSLSRLAFPIETRFVFVTTDDDDFSAATAMIGAFSEVISEEDQQALIRVASAPRRIKSRTIPREIYSGARQRFANTYQISQFSIERREAKPRPHRDRHRPTYSLAFDGDVEVARFSSGTPDARQINRLIQVGTERSYSLDDGIPYPTHAPSGLALVDEVPVSRGDPNVKTRAAAFAGWALLAEEFAAEAPRVMFELRTRTRAGQ